MYRLVLYTCIRFVFESSFLTKTLFYYFIELLLIRWLIFEKYFILRALLFYDY